MNTIQLKDQIAMQAKAITEDSLDRNILRILLKDKIREENEKQIIEELKKHYNGSLYCKIIFELTHINIRDNNEARDVQQNHFT